MDDPENSNIFKKYPDFMKRKEALTFLTDSFRTIISTKILYYDLNTLLEDEVEAYYEELEHEATLTNEIAESFPEDQTIGKRIRRPKDYKDPDPKSSYMVSKKYFDDLELKGSLFE